MRPAARAATTLVCLATAACGAGPAPDATDPARSAMERRVAQYTTVRLDPDVSHLDDDQRRMVRLLVEAAEAMDRVFWRQAFGDPAELMAAIGDPATRRYAEINYGPWDRLEEDAPFVDGYGAKPKGARFYPEDATAEEIEQAAERDPAVASLYTVVRRVDDGLEAVPYHEVWEDDFALAAERLRQAAALAGNASLKRYLEARAGALVTGDYRDSDFAWMDVEDNDIDVVIGPIETYEDLLLGWKAAASATVMLRDREWSRRLQRYAEVLPELQRGLPVPDEYKAETPGSDADLGAYDTLYVAGDSNAAVKALAFNLPNDEQVQLEKGTRRVQLKSAMRAKFEMILAPIAGVLIAENQRAHVTFDAFFANGMFHEVAHGLGTRTR